MRNVDKIGLGKNCIESVWAEKSEGKNTRKWSLERVLSEISKAKREFFADIGVFQWKWCFGKYAIVIGNRTVSSVKVPTDKIIVEIGGEIGFMSEHSAGRSRQSEFRGRTHLKM